MRCTANPPMSQDAPEDGQDSLIRCPLLTIQEPKRARAAASAWWWAFGGELECIIVV